ncbi:MAG: hypothetical protein WCD49_12750 [Candidatus Acidiferrales bacterium]
MKTSEAFMKSRYAASKLFFGSAILFATVGALLFRRVPIGRGLDAADYLNPLFWVTIPRLIPFTASILSVCFGLAYLGFEKTISRSVNFALAVVQFVLLLVATIGHSALISHWWAVLAEESSPKKPLSSLGLLTFASFVLCCLVFGANMLWSLSKTPVLDSERLANTSANS